MALLVGLPKEREDGAQQVPGRNMREVDVVFQRHFGAEFLRRGPEARVFVHPQAASGPGSPVDQLVGAILNENGLRFQLRTRRSMVQRK